MGVLLGIDIGTHRSKAVLCTPQGEVVARADRTHGVDHPQPGWAEHDPDRTWWAELVDLARELSAAAQGHGEVVGVGVTTCGPCLVPVDEADWASNGRRAAESSSPAVGDAQATLA